MAWYEESFGSEYLKLYAHRNLDEARKNIHSILGFFPLSKEEPVLDLCCGAGRHLLVLRELGFCALTGLDLSAELLQEAGQKLAGQSLAAQTLAGEVSLIRGDMRAIPYANHFAAILSLFTSFGYFKADEENQAVLVAAHRSLRPGGIFLLDYLNRERVIANLVPQDEKTIPGGHVQNLRCVTEDCLRIEKTTTVTVDGVERQFHESVRAYSQAEMVERFRAAGFGNIRCYGSVDGRKFTPESERLILVGEKPC